MPFRTAFLVALIASLLPFAASAQEPAERARAMLKTFESQFQDTAFGPVVSLGSPRLIDWGIDTNLTIEIKPGFHIPGKYYPPEALLGGRLRNSLLVVRDMDAASAVTVWHEFKHHLVRLLLGSVPCSEEEIYMVLLEDRFGWLDRAKKTVDRYAKEPQTNGILKMRRAWKDLADEWAGKKVAGRNLSGPFMAGDPDNTCREGGGKVFIIDAAFIAKMDRTLGIDVDIAKVRRAYSRLDERLPNLSGTWCLERGERWEPMTIPVRQTEEELVYTVRGRSVIGDFADAATLLFYDGPRIAATGKLAADGKRIAWSNNSFWRKAAAATCEPEAGWTGVYVSGSWTVRIQQTGAGSITASDLWIDSDDGKPVPHRTTSQWHNCRLEGNTATCGWTSFYTDVDKDMQRSGALTATLTGDALRVVIKEAKPRATWRVPEYASSMHEGKVWDTTFQRQK